MTVLHAEAAVDKFHAGLYTQAEASRYLGLPQSTLRNWARGYRVVVGTRETIGRPVITALPSNGRRSADIPFVGLAEGYALAAFRRAGVPLQRIRPALEELDRELGIRHALASERLHTDGAEVLFDHGAQAGKDVEAAVRELVVVRNGQRVFAEAVDHYLKRIVIGDDGFASLVPLPGFERAELVADVTRSFGQPIFTHGGARLEDVVSLFTAERDIAVVAEEFGIPRRELEDVLAVMIARN